jgi:hypothetical protein
MSKQLVGISNTTLAVQRLIHDVKFHTVWFREILKNALEATTYYLSNNIDFKTPARIKVRGLPLFEILYSTKKVRIEHTQPKLSILNYGGMSVTELRKACELFSSGSEKVQDHLKNFGVGMKIVLAKFTDVLIITKKGDEVWSLVFGLEDTGLVIKQKPNDVTEWADVNAGDRGYDMEHDWTEIVVLGRGELNWMKQNTVRNTFSDNKGNRIKNIAMQQAYERFVDIPKNIEIVFESGKNGDWTPHNAGPKSGNVVFKTREEMFERGINADSNTEAFVEEVVHNGIKFYLRYDAPRSKDQEPVSTFSENRLGVRSRFGGIIWGDKGQRERYAIVNGNTWISAASAVGILCDHKYFTIDIELPYAEYQPVTDRTGVQLRNPDLTNDEELEPVTFKKLVVDLREAIQKSERFKAKVEQHNQKNPPLGVRDMMKDMMDEFFDSLKEFSPVQGNTPSQQNGNEKNTKHKPKMPADIDFTNHGLSCPDCRKQGVITKLPKGTLKCPVCGFEKKYNTNKTNKKLNSEPFYPDIRDSDAIDDYALAESENVVLVNPKHSCVDNLYSAVMFRNPGCHTLPQTLQDDIRYHGHKIISAEIGVTTIIARLTHLKDSEWFDIRQLEGKLDSRSLTLDAMRTDKFIDKASKYAQEVLKKNLSAEFYGKQESLDNDVWKSKANSLVDSQEEKQVKWQPSVTVEGYQEPCI